MYQFKPHFIPNLNVFPASVQSYIDILAECNTYGIPLVTEMERALFEKHLFSLDKPSNIVHLETSLFELGSLPKVVSGVFYMLPIYSDGKLFVR